jgi:hypothetical protein
MGGRRRRNLLVHRQRPDLDVPRPFLVVFSLRGSEQKWKKDKRQMVSRQREVRDAKLEGAIIWQLCYDDL